MLFIIDIFWNLQFLKHFMIVKVISLTILVYWWFTLIIKFSI